MLPPSIAVMTGAAVAVGHRAHIMARLGQVAARGRDGEVEPKSQAELQSHDYERERPDVELGGADTAECDEQHREDKRRGQELHVVNDVVEYESEHHRDWQHPGLEALTEI